MADELEGIPQAAADNIDRSMGEAPSSMKVQQKKAPPSYKLLGDAKIAVSSQRGKLWQSRVKQAKSRIKDMSDAWDECIQYYKNDQTPHRGEGGDRPGNATSHRISDQSKETENVVFANVSALTPRIYAKNPEISVNPLIEGEEQQEFARVCKQLLNALTERAASPGINLKLKAKKAVVITQLTNLVWAKVEWTAKEESSEQANSDIQELSTELAEAKSKTAIENIEGKLMAIDEKYDVLQPSGPKLKILLPKHLLTDACVEPDFSDTMWMAEMDFLPTSYLKARFTQKDDGKKTTLVFNPTHVVKTTGDQNDGIDDTINNFSIFQEDDAKKYGYEDTDQYEKAKRTKVWWIWDKVTRRVELYMDNDWTWPLWVWDDPLQLDTFFPYFPLSFVIPAEGAMSKGEVSYYLDQQDAINEINEAEREARRWAKWNIWYNTNLIDDTTMEKILSGGKDRGAYGIKLPEGVDMTKAVFSVPPPSAQFANLFNKESKYAAIDRIASVNGVGRGEQFKTNTTNQAIARYENTSSMRLDDKIDAIEDWLNKIYWALLQLCLMYMPAEQVAAFIGDKDAARWQNFDAKTIRNKVSFSLEAGSTQRQNSDAKKDTAIKVSQVLGQFAQATPMALVTALKVLERAFDEVVITDEDWKAILGSVEQQLQQAASTAAGPPATDPNTPPVPGTPPDENMIKSHIASMSPQEQQQVAELIKQGADPVQAIQQVHPDAKVHPPQK